MNIEQLISEIRYQHPLGVTTWSQCATDGCENSARGGRQCVSCLEHELASQAGWPKARLFVAHTKLAHESARAMMAVV